MGASHCVFLPCQNDPRRKRNFRRKRAVPDHAGSAYKVSRDHELRKKKTFAFDSEKRIKTSAISKNIGSSLRANASDLLIEHQKYEDNLRSIEAWKSESLSQATKEWQKDIKSGTIEAAEKLLKVLKEIKALKAYGKDFKHNPVQALRKMRFFSEDKDAELHFKFGISGFTNMITDQLKKAKTLDGEMLRGDMTLPGEIECHLKVTLAQKGKKFQFGKELYHEKFSISRNGENYDLAPLPKITIKLEKFKDQTRPIVMSLKILGTWNHVAFTDLADLLSRKARARIDFISRDTLELMLAKGKIIQKTSQEFLHVAESDMLTTKQQLEKLGTDDISGFGAGWLIIFEKEIGIENRVNFEIDKQAATKIKHSGIEGVTRGRGMNYINYIINTLEDARVEEITSKLRLSLRLNNYHQITGAVAACYNTLPKRLVDVVDQRLHGRLAKRQNGGLESNLKKKSIIPKLSACENFLDLSLHVYNRAADVKYPDIKEVPDLFFSMRHPETFSAPGKNLIGDKPVKVTPQGAFWHFRVPVSMIEKELPILFELSSLVREVSYGSCSIEDYRDLKRLTPSTPDSVFELEIKLKSGSIIDCAAPYSLSFNSIEVCQTEGEIIV